MKASAAGTLLLRPVNRALDAWERRTAHGDSFGAPPLFIIGAPRTGSTVLFQALITAYDVAYFSNLHCHLFGSPTLVERVLRGARAAPGSEYRSEFGRTTGLLGPSECGAFWYRWFPRAPHVAERDTLSLAQAGSLRRVLSRWTEVAGRSLLFKNMLCALRLQVLAPLLPEARFIVIRRAPLWTAQSLLLARSAIHGTMSRWWSMQPPGWEAWRALPPEEQVVRQIAGIESRIHADTAALGPDRFQSVCYEDLCENPAAMLEAIAVFARRAGSPLEVRTVGITALRRDDGPRLEPALFDRLRGAVERQFGESAARV